MLAGNLDQVGLAEGIGYFTSQTGRNLKVLGQLLIGELGRQGAGEQIEQVCVLAKDMLVEDGRSTESQENSNLFRQGTGRRPYQSRLQTHGRI